MWYRLENKIDKYMTDGGVEVKYSRRSFLKVLGLSSAGAAMSSCTTPTAPSSGEPISPVSAEKVDSKNDGLNEIERLDRLVDFTQYLTSLGKDEEVKGRQALEAVLLNLKPKDKYKFLLEPNPFLQPLDKILTEAIAAVPVVANLCRFKQPNLKWEPDNSRPKTIHDLAKVFKNIEIDPVSKRIRVEIDYVNHVYDSPFTFWLANRTSSSRTESFIPDRSSMYCFNEQETLTNFTKYYNDLSTYLDTLKRPATASDVIAYCIARNNGDITTGLFDTNALLKGIARMDFVSGKHIGAGGNLVDYAERVKWFVEKLQDTFLPLAPWSELHKIYNPKTGKPNDNLLMLNQNIESFSCEAPELSLIGAIGGAYHQTDPLAALVYLPPSYVQAGVIAAMQQRETDQGHIKMAANFYGLSRLSACYDILKRYSALNS